MKIFCKNCKHFKNSSDREGRCYFKIQETTDSKSKSAGKIINEGQSIWRNYDKFNGDNDCKYYKKKWWKKIK